LPHILPDLPVYLFWAEEPSISHPLFTPLARMATRIIFDSESADNLYGFAQTLLTLKGEKKLEVADLNWARLEGWRDLLASAFDSKERIADLHDIKEITITFNARETEYFCHLKIQAMYLLALLSSRLSWQFQKAQNKKGSFHFQFADNISATVESAFWQNLGPGAILSMSVKTGKGSHYQFTRNPKATHQVAVQISTLDRCELPYQFVLGKSHMGQSLVREIFLKGTSSFFLQMLCQLTLLDQGRIC
jgi:glucose-6-phosphate dehydrogenase assembly protein OpcA